MQIKNQIDTRLQDPIYFNLINKIDLGRVILDYYYNTHNMIFWVANQNTLLFGPARRGIKEAQSGDIFKIPLDKLKTISTSDDKHENLIALKTTIKFNEFIQQEKKKMALNRLRKQLNVETPKKKQAS
jgi:hypothetical protein